MSGRSTSRDEFGWKRGLGAYSKDDKQFGSPKHTTDSLTVQNKKHDYLIDSEVDQPAGKMLGGGGPVSYNKRTPGAPRFAPKTGPIGNMRKPK